MFLLFPDIHKLYYTVRLSSICSGNNKAHTETLSKEFQAENSISFLSYLTSTLIGARALCVLAMCKSNIENAEDGQREREKEIQVVQSSSVLNSKH